MADGTRTRGLSTQACWARTSPAPAKRTAMASMPLGGMSLGISLPPWLTRRASAAAGLGDVPGVDLDLPSPGPRRSAPGEAVALEQGHHGRRGMDECLKAVPTNPAPGILEPQGDADPPPIAGIR